MISKKINKDFVLIMIILSGIFLGVCFVVANTVDRITPSTSFNESVVYVLNISINNTDGGGSSGEGNITQVNITLPAEFTFITGTNQSSADLAFNNVTFSASGQVLSWWNGSGNRYVVNGSGGKVNETFVVNITAGTPGAYNITVKYLNKSGSFETNLTFIVNDTQAPNVSAVNIPVNHGNYSGTIILNATIDDSKSDGSSLIDTIYVNITDSNGLMVNLTNNLTSNLSNVYWNLSLNTAALPDGKYNITFMANDTTNNLNGTETIPFTIDNSAPSIILTEKNTSKTTIGVSIAITDPTSTVYTTCTAERGGDRIQGIVIGTGHSQTLYETGLSCGGTYSYTVSCTDHAGNTGTKSINNIDVLSCGSSGSSGGSSGGSGTTVYSKTYNANTEEFIAGYTKQLAKQERIKVSINNVDHQVGVKSLTESTATIEIASTSKEATLAVGDERKFDVNDDGTYDLYVKLNSIEANKADITIKSISEKVTDTTIAEEQQKQDDATGKAEKEEGEKDLTWLWIVIGIIVVLVLVGVGYKVKKR